MVANASTLYRAQSLPPLEREQIVRRVQDNLTCDGKRVLVICRRDFGVRKEADHKRISQECTVLFANFSGKIFRSLVTTCVVIVIAILDSAQLDPYFMEKWATAIYINSVTAC